MKETKNSPNKLKQTKITAFCSTSDKNRKRKNAADVSQVHKTPVKRVAKSDSRSPDLFRTTLQNETNNENFENFAFDDFENDPFSSPRKTDSPKKNILTENLSGNEASNEVKSEISFETPVKCKVVKAACRTGKYFEQVLHLIDVTTNKTGVCKLREVWASSIVSIGDIVSIQAVFSDECWVVDNKNGYLILHPDILISSTNLSQSMFCLRQGVLYKIFKDTSSSDSNSKMLIGRLIHELFQESLKTGSDSDEEFHKIIARFMESRENLTELFFTDMNASDIQKEMENFIPRVRKFLDVYVNKKESPTGKNYTGSIESIVDIEEIVKSDTLGLQGRVDVTVNVRSKKTEGVAPLELKTGRASFSQEHRIQLILYVLLMNELGRKVDSGLLLYLREDILEEISPQRDDIRNLFLLRNRFVGFFKNLASGSLPEPIYNAKGCAKCSYLRICTSYLKNEDGGRISQGHPLRSVQIPDAKPTHVDYFLRWNKMLWLEFDDVFKETKDEISDLILEPNIVEFKEEFKCNFRKSRHFKNETFRSGIFVNILDGKNNLKATGHILEASDSVISVLTNTKLRDFSGFYKIIAFKSNFLYFYLNNLGWLLNEEFESLRELIIDKKTPSFDKNLNKADFQEKCLNNLLSLNREQQKAVLKSLLCRDYLLIKGPPGTGKTQTIVTLIKILLALDKTVLIVGHTHSSVDNILLRLEGVEYLRLGSLKSVREEIRKNSYGFLIENCCCVEDVKKLFDRKLIASTCMGIDTDFIRRMKLDYCIVDESSQVLQPEILRPLFCCKKFILVGDEDQLPPIVRNPQAKKMGMDKSLFEWLSTDSVTVKLKQQYRMNSVINSLANKITYKGLIECGNEKVAKATMKIPKLDVYHQQDKWVVEVLSNDLKKSVVFIDTSEYFQKNSIIGLKRSSVVEANIVAKLVSCLIEFGVKEESIGVVTPFLDQISLLTVKLKELGKIELNTVDQFQGRDKDVILFSCGKENQPMRKAVESGLLNDKRRLTVAVTRAKHKLIILGDKKTVIKYKPFENLVNNMDESQFFCLSDGKMNFYWENFIN